MRRVSPATKRLWEASAPPLDIERLFEGLRLGCKAALGRGR